MTRDGISILLGRGDGTFEPTTLLEVPSGARSMAVADLDSDGFLDLVTGSEWNVVRRTFGKGDGTFGAQTDAEVRGGPFSVAVADFDRDGRADIATANYDDLSPQVSILLGRRDGTFAEQQGFGQGIGPIALVVSDLNSDGTPDIVVANGRRDYISVLLGVGDGTFHEQRDMSVGIQPTSLANADLDGDGHQDLVVAGNHQTAAILLGRGDGSFSLAGGVSVGIYPNSVAIADLDGDGTLDLAVANAESNSLSVAAGNGDGTFQGAFDLLTGDVPASASIADFNGDGKPDLVVSNSGSNTVSIFLNETPAVPAGSSLAIAVPSNPVTGGLVLGVRLPKSGSAEVEVYDAAGRRVAVRRGLSSAGPQELRFPEAANWKPGIYLARITQGSTVATTRACIVR